MKKHLHNSLRALFLSLSVLLSLPMLAEEVEIDGINYELVAKAKHATVIAKSSGKYSGEAVIPESVEHEGTAYSVTSIGDYAFQNCSGLTSVTIPNSVTSIGESAFRACSGLTSLTIPNSVTSIGGYAFYGCTSLFNITIPSGISKIENHTFVDCISLTRITIPDNITEIGEYAFRGCRKINKLLIGSSVNSILTNAFEYCSGLTLLVLPKSLRWVSSNVFHGCTNLKTVINFSSETPKRGEIDCGYAGYYAERIANRSDGNMYLDGDFVFNRTNSGNELLAYLGSDSYITLPDWSNNGDESYSISGGIFKNDKTVISITVPKSVIGIGSEAFYGCSGLTSVTIPNSVTSIGDYTFYDCSGLTSVTIPNSVTSIGERAFFDCSGLTSVTIPNSVTSIGSSAFYGCSGLTSVTIGNSVTSIGGYAFADCPELLDVYCYAEKAPSTNSYAFDGSYPEYATLHVPDASVESYKATAPWSGFGKIVALTDEEHIVDGTLEEYVNESERSPIDIHYTRTLPNMLWNPLYVPFKIPYEDLQENYEVAYINAMHSYDNDDNGEIDDMVMEIVKIKAGTLKPNHPYLIKGRNAEAMEMSIVQENTTLYPSEITTLDCSSVYTKFEITGTYQKMTSEDLNGSLVISTDGAWKKLSSTSTLKPFRFYLTISSREGSPVEIADEAMSRVRIRVMGEDDNATGIDEVNTANDEQKSEIYDLSGRRVSAPAKGGVYIIKGKKVIY